MNDTLTHVTLNSGHRAAIRRDQLADGVVANLRPLALGTANIFPAPSGAYRAEVDWDHVSHCAIFTVSTGAREPLVTCLVCPEQRHAARAWALAGTFLSQLGGETVAALRIARMPARPRAPWQATLIWPTAVADPDAAHWMADFTQCLSWTIIEEVRAGVLTRAPEGE